MSEKVGAVMIVGGGISGMQAALDLAESGLKIYLIEDKPSIGGVMVQLDKTFPTMDCAMCTIAPRLVNISRHPNIEVITYAGVDKVNGSAGNFKVRVKKRARYVNEDRCTGCGVCREKCPWKVDSEFEAGIGKRKAIYTPFPQAVPNIPVIDREHCAYFVKGKCRACEKFCEAKAIDFEQKDKLIEVEVGAIIIAPGYELFDPRLKADLGFGLYPNVISSLQFERLLSPTGPTGGKIQRPSDSKAPESLAFIQCVGSRDFDRDYCSAVCCMYATKEAILAKEYLGEELRCDVFYMDIRAYSKGFEEYYNRAKSLGINYIRSRPPAITEVPETRNLIIEYLTKGDRKLRGEYELVVLSAGLAPPRYASEIAEKFNLELNKYGFCSTNLFTPVSSPKKGIFVAGAFTGPKDIPESVMQGCAAAAQSLSLLSAEKGKLVEEKVYPPERDIRGKTPRVGVFVCHCGKNIAGVIDPAEVAEYAKTLPNVVCSEHLLYTCSTDSGEKIKQLITEHSLNRVVVAACTPRTHEPLFQSILSEAGLNPYLFEMANIRDQCTWVHANEPETALVKAKDLVRMAVARARLLEPLYRKKVKINRNALVIGGGVSGLVSALELADQGFEIYLIERSDTLGGNLRRVKLLLNGDNPEERLKLLIDRAQHHPKIHIYTNSQILNITGSVGNFTTEFKSNGTFHSIRHGVVIVATGGQEYKPTEYLYGEDKRVITQLELEEKLTNGELVKAKPGTVVMIQCVGSRNELHPYCSRICCSQAIKNALKIKEQSADTHVFVLYRDMRTYGFDESYYTQAREKGVRFIIYEGDKQPLVERFDGQLKVLVYDPVLDTEIDLKADLLVLSTGVVPQDDAKELAQKLKVPLTGDGFFLEAHMKLRPVDFATDGVFLCGLAHFPKRVDESIAQA
ncbi:FAD-dependent oxidoreductase, partial [Dehalococcoidales bacterium]|nr:FAD-dependent oxidoreductase [Dehalococcoidales bacterium]